LSTTLHGYFRNFLELYAPDRGQSWLWPALPVNGTGDPRPNANNYSVLRQKNCAFALPYAAFGRNAEP